MVAKTPPNIEQEIIQAFLSGEKQSQEIVKEFSISNDTLYVILKRNGYGEYIKRVKFIDEQKDRIIELVQQGLSLSEIGRQLNISDVSVKNSLKRSGYSHLAPKSSREISDTLRDPHYWDNIDTPQKAILLGWFVSDGNLKVIENDHYMITFSLKNDVSENIFAQQYSEIFNCKIYDNHKRGQIVFRYSSKSHAIALENMGYGRNLETGLTKTYNIVQPPIDVDDPLFTYFMTGIISGDGHVNCLKNRFTIVAKHREQLEPYLRWINKRIDVDSDAVKIRYQENKTGSAHTLSIWRKREFNQVMTALTENLPPYPTIEYPYLMRKFSPFIEIKSTL